MAQFIGFSLVGLVIIFLSYLIKYKKMAFLISGYDEDLVKDKDGLCNWVDGTVIWVGVYAIVTGFVLYLRPDMWLMIGLSFGLFTVIICVVTIAGSRKFKKQV